MLRFSILSWCLLGLMVTSSVQAAFESWTAVGLYGGRVVEVAVAPSDPQVIYAVTLMGGVFRSVDGGVTWGRASNEGNFANSSGLMVDPGDENLAFVFGPFGFARTQDGGTTWQSVGGGFSGQRTCSMAFAPSDPQIIYASGSSYNTIKSLDGGATWTQISTQTRCSLAVDPANPEVLFGSSNAGLEKSTDGGESWEVSQPLSGLDFISATVFDPQDSQTIYFGNSADFGDNTTGGVYRSTDGGQHWESVLQEPIWSLTVAPSDPQQLVAGGADGVVFRSADGGANWQDGMQICIDEDCDVLSLSIDSTNPFRVLAAAGGAGGIFGSADGGQSFHVLNQGLGGGEIAALAVSPDGSKFFAQTSPSGIFLSEDLGSTWRLVNEEAPAPSSLDARIIFDPQDPSTIYALGGDIYRSTDGGETWSAFYLGLPNGITDLAIDPRDSEVLYGTRFEGMLKSVDGGNSWVESGPPGLYALAVALDPKDPDVVFVGTSERLHRSPDGGTTWEVVSSFPYHTLVTRLAFDPLRPEDFYVVTTGRRGLYRGFDDGRVLVRVEEVEGRVRDLVFDPTEAGHLLMAATDGVYEAGSYGFRFLGTEFSTYGASAVALAPGNPYTVLAGASGVSRITLVEERCFPSANLLCLDDQPGDRRFMARIQYDTALGGGLRGMALATSLEDLGTYQGGIFSFFDSDNPEALVKVVNGCGVNQHYWVYAAAATTVGFNLNVFDMVSGVMSTWSNPDQNRAVPVADTRALASCSTTSNGEGSALRAVDPSPPLGRATASSEGPCIPDSTTLCIDDRFAVRLHFDTVLGGGLSGNAEALPLASAGVEDGGVFSFFDRANPEVLVKIVDGCAFNGHYWVFTAATTTVGYELTVEDTDRGEMVMYENVDGTAAETVTDATAFATCDP